MNENTVEYLAKCGDGVVVKIYKQKGLHRAYNAKGEQVGLPFVELGNLLKDIGAELTPAGLTKAEQTARVMEGEAAQGGVRPGQEAPAVGQDMRGYAEEKEAPVVGPLGEQEQGTLRVPAEYQGTLDDGHKPA